MITFWIIIAIVILFIVIYSIWLKHCDIQRKIKEKVHLKDEIIKLRNTKNELQSNYEALQQSYNQTIVLEENKLDNYAQRIKDKQESLELLEKAAQEKQEHLDYEFRTSAADYAIKLEEYKKQCAINQDKLMKEQEKLELTIAALNEIVIKAAQEQEEKNKNKLLISDNNINDIKLLWQIRNQFSNPRVISKLIWQTYYQPVAKEKFSIILNNTTKTGIYKITNDLNGKIYIGQAADIYKRWCDHAKCGCGLDTPHNNKLYKAMLEDGLYNFTFELLEECPREQLNEKEKYYIDLYQTVIYGYNSQGGING